MKKLLQIVKSTREMLYLIFFKLTNNKRIDFLNLGGGPNFMARGWLNLEEVKSKFNPVPFKFTPDCTFPLEKSRAKVVYTSHCLEHLDNSTIYRLLEEIKRVLKDRGSLIIKLPDFDHALSCWKRNENSAFEENLWGFKIAMDTWKNYGVKDCLDYRAAMIFCGFWNDEYGNPFANDISKNELAYHGPPKTTIDFLHNLIKNHTPSQISAELCKIVIKNEKNYHFNHRNAWSREELKALLNSFGFYVQSFDKDLIISKYSYIPYIRQMERQSMYCWAKLKN